MCWGSPRNHCGNAVTLLRDGAPTVKQMLPIHVFGPTLTQNANGLTENRDPTTDPPVDFVPIRFVTTLTIDFD